MLCYHSQGGFMHSDVYSMPVYLRRFYVQCLVKAKKEEEKQMKKANKKPSNTPSRPAISRPAARRPATPRR